MPAPLFGPPVVRRKRLMTAPAASIAEAFVRNARRAPNRFCLRFEDEEWTYQRLRVRVEIFAAALMTWGLQEGDRVALFLGNYPDFLAAYLGTHLAGGVVVPVNTQYRRGGQRHIFGGAGGGWEEDKAGLHSPPYLVWRL